MKFKQFREWLSLLPRRWKQTLLVGFDAVMLFLMAWLAYILRFGELFIPNAHQLLLMIAAPVIALPVFVRLGLYRSVIRYLPDRAVWTIIQAVCISVLLWVCLAFLTQMTGIEGVPRSVPAFYLFLAIAAIAGSRFGAKWLLWNPLREKLLSKQCLIFGAGDAGRQLANALKANQESYVTAFVDDDPGLHGMEILGIRVYPTAKLEELIENFGVNEVIVTTSSLNARKRRDLLARLSQKPVKTRILPAITDLTSGKYLVSTVRDIDIDDLLGRSPVPPEPELLQKMVEGRTILVTGAGGSIGSELCRVIVKLCPAKLILFELNEHALYQIERELKLGASCEIVPVLGSATEMPLVERVLRKHKVETVYHCAAYKHVPLVEENPVEGIRNNVFGTVSLASCAFACDVQNFILISSDKAVHPSNVMGATKRWSELIVRYYGMEAEKRGMKRNFACVRFGNVIGSNGSVVPLFREQIAMGGPLTVTHAEMTRYFMSIREAAELIVQAGALSESGDILLLEMGEPVRIYDLAENMILLAGLSVRDRDNPDGDVEISIIGARDGEKLHEELFYDPAGVMPTRHTKIMRATQRTGHALEELPDLLDKLRLAIEHQDSDEVRHILYDFIARKKTAGSAKPNAGSPNTGLIETIADE
ncbi:MAG: polysaccharide biosynthesis protein [Phyllobacterium sp.]